MSSEIHFVYKYKSLVIYIYDHESRISPPSLETRDLYISFKIHKYKRFAYLAI